MKVNLRRSIENKFDIKIPLSSKMEDSIEMWRRMYEDDPVWKEKGVEPIGIPPTIASEIARLVTMEMEVGVQGSPMADFLDECLQKHLKSAREYTEYACALGGVMMKPYYSAEKNTIEVNVIHQDEFLPTRYNSDKEIIGAIFPDQVIINDQKYTRLERHEMIGNNIIIQNKVFVKKVDDLSSDLDSVLGDECLLTDVPQWKYVQPVTIIRNVDKPLFAYFKMPMANHIEKRSPMGVSVYAKAQPRIKRADKQWAKIAWEFDATELAVFADDDMFRHSPYGEISLPEREKRIFRTLDGFEKKIEIFSPAIRESSLFAGLQSYLRVIEFQCNVAYGTLSDPNTVDKTAEEIKASKQRSFSFVCDVQKAFKTAHDDLVEAMHTLALLYGICQDGEYETSYDFDDSIAVNRSEMFKELMQMVSAGMIKPEFMVAWYFGVSEEEAMDMLPPAFDDTAETIPEGQEEE